jgi:hypothetical protein
LIPVNGACHDRGRPSFRLQSWRISRRELAERGVQASREAKRMTDPYAADYPQQPAFLWLFLGKVLLLAITIVVVWSTYGYLHAYRLEWLGWTYSKLQPVTNGLYTIVETYLPGDMKYKIRGAITDDLGQRSLFLLLLTAAVELTLYSLFKLARMLTTRLRHG